MLVLGRRHKESVTITAPNGDVLRVTVARMPGVRLVEGVPRQGPVRIGFECPRDYEILRDELVETEGESCG